MAAKIFLVLGRLFLQVRKVDVAQFITGDGDDFQPGDHRAGGVGAVGAGGDQADGAVMIATRFVIGADNEQTRILARAPGVRLQRDGSEAGDFAQPVFELLEHLLISAGLIPGGERMHPPELRPSNRDHFAGRV